MSADRSGYQNDMGEKPLEGAVHKRMVHDQGEDRPEPEAVDEEPTEHLNRPEQEDFDPEEREQYEHPIAEATIPEDR
jgi:hypothetical protein